MTSSDTNLHHLATKSLLLICGAHRPWLTAGHAEGIKRERMWRRGTNCRNKTHTHTNIIYFCPCQSEPSCTHTITLICGQWYMRSSIVNAKESHPWPRWCCPFLTMLGTTNDPHAGIFLLILMLLGFCFTCTDWSFASFPPLHP